MQSHKEIGKVFIDNFEELYSTDSPVIPMSLYDKDVVLLEEDN